MPARPTSLLTAGCRACAAATLTAALTAGSAAAVAGSDLQTRPTTGREVAESGSFGIEIIAARAARPAEPVSGAAADAPGNPDPAEDRAPSTEDSVPPWGIVIEPLPRLVAGLPLFQQLSVGATQSAAQSAPAQPVPAQRSASELAREQWRARWLTAAAGPAGSPAGSATAATVTGEPGIVIEAVPVPFDRGQFEYRRVYESIPFRRSEFQRDPSYRHEAVMELLTGHPRPAPAPRVSVECHCDQGIAPWLLLYPPSDRPGYRPWSRYPWH